ncbi:uncharacterized protein A1O9_04562 [Exophiala aquamarina CBS 119918]|uniref:protein-histidine N-methyltransferase n=1 Tax=Exophiala aquamarina CBS 119918 TaxID=1182545 RepID=A0A072PIM4_9EURO|nr:uncharacterized protein A1O9_04562 [Exophiala aquamarina CBS 119918]KEF59716.1 hypothetical protein A1O9_04562 [Exophiala aquamarina CBS 119918]
MSFSFGFSGDDIEDDGQDEEQAGGLINDMLKHFISEHTAGPSQTIAPRMHTLRELLQHAPSQLSYNTLKVTPRRDTTQSAYVPSTNVSLRSTAVRRRSLFDIRAQLMAEVSPEEHEHNVSENLLSGLESGDLTSGVYEGGFKTWECALDLASLCSGLNFRPSGLSGWDIVEMGAGSAIPSLAILRNYLSNGATADLRMTLCDYNEDVLRLVTAPNVLVNCSQQAGTVPSSSTSPADELSEEGEFDVEALGPHFIDDLETSLRQHRISLNFLSGGWGDSFNDLFASLSSEANSTPPEPRHLLILASETIYSLASTKIFAATLLQLIRKHRQNFGASDAKAWVAAKKVYFGVGGGVDDFTHEIESHGGKAQVLYETSDTGVGRVILEVMLSV